MNNMISGLVETKSLYIYLFGYVAYMYKCSFITYCSFLGKREEASDWLVSSQLC